MKARGHIVARGGRMPGRNRRQQLHKALDRFQHAYGGWLREREKPEPRAEQFGLTRSQVATVIRHCRAMHVRNQ